MGEQEINDKIRHGVVDSRQVADKDFQVKIIRVQVSCLIRSQLSPNNWVFTSLTSEIIFFLSTKIGFNKVFGNIVLTVCE